MSCAVPTGKSSQLAIMKKVTAPVPRAGRKVIFLVLFLIVFTGGYSQVRRITYTASGKPLSEVLEDLSALHGMKFAYDAEVFSHIPVSVSVNKQTPEKVIELLSRICSLNFRMIENTWIVTRQTGDREMPEAGLTSQPLSLKKKQISGFVSDKTTGEPLVYCNIVFPNSWGTITNELGYFYLETASDSVRFYISHLGYQRLDTVIPATLTSPVRLRLKPLSVMVKEVNVVMKEKSIMELSEYSGRVGFNPSRSAYLPRLSNDDLANMLTLIPGVSLLSGAMGGLSIRGSNPSDNLILLDGIPLLETGHLFGNLSVLNAGFIRQAFVSRGAFDARFGDRAAGLIELTGTTGSKEHYSMEASANLLNGDLIATVPVTPALSLSCAWRRSFVDHWQNYLFQKLLGETSLTGISDAETNVLPTVRYQDINFKTTLRLAPGNELTLSFLRGSDQQMLDYEVGKNPLLYRNEWISETNTGFSGNWSFQSGKWNHTLTSAYSELKHAQENESGEQVTLPSPSVPGWQNLFKQKNKIKVYNPSRNKYEFDSDSNRVTEFRLLWKSELKSGNVTHQFGAGFISNYFGYSFSTMNSDFRIPVDSLRNSANQNISHFYVQQYYEPFSYIKFRWGMRLNYSQVTARLYWQPRMGIDILLLRNLKIYYNGGIYHQFLTRVPKIDISHNVDMVWYLPDDREKGLMKSVHHVAGMEWETDGFLVNAEIYGRHTTGKQWLYAENYRFKWQNRIRYVDKAGEEKNKGLDLLVQYRHSKWYHQLAWSFSKSQEKINGINGNAYFPSLSDHRHQLQWTELFTVRGWSVSASWIFRTGQPRILPDSKLTSLSFERLPVFSQTDAGFGKNIRFRHTDLSAGMSLLNIFNRLNIVQVDYLNISTSTASLNVKSNISTISFTPVFYLRLKYF